MVVGGFAGPAPVLEPPLPDADELVPAPVDDEAMLLFDMVDCAFDEVVDGGGGWTWTALVVDFEREMLGGGAFVKPGAALDVDVDDKGVTDEEDEACDEGIDWTGLEVATLVIVVDDGATEEAGADCLTPELEAGIVTATAEILTEGTEVCDWTEGRIAEVEGAVLLTPDTADEGPACGLVVIVTLGDITGLMMDEEGAVWWALLLDDAAVEGGTLELLEGGPIENTGREVEDCDGVDCEAIWLPVVGGADIVDIGDVDGGVARGWWLVVKVCAWEYEGGLSVELLVLWATGGVVDKLVVCCGGVWWVTWLVLLTEGGGAVLEPLECDEEDDAAGGEACTGSLLLWWTFWTIEVVRCFDGVAETVEGAGGGLFRVSNEARKQFSDFGRGRFTLARAFVNSFMSHLSLSLSLVLLLGGGGSSSKSSSSSSWSACSERAVTIAETDWSSALAATKLGFFPILFSLQEWFNMCISLVL